MPVLSVYTAGVSMAGIELINEAVTQVFGEGNVTELGRDNLRYKVRSGFKDPSVVLIILDNTSTEECQDIEDGLYNSDKYFKYTDDKKLVDFLNSFYEISLEIPDELTSVSSSIMVQEKDENKAELSELYSQLRDKDSIIKTLNLHIKELEQIINLEGYSMDSSEVEELKEANLNLKNNVSDLLNKIENLEGKVQSKTQEVSELSVLITDLKEKYGKLESSCNSLNKELSEERVLSSQKSGVLHDKDKEIEKLKSSIKSQKAIEDTTEYLNKTIKDLKIELRDLNLEISKKNSEISILKSDLEREGKTEERVQKYKELLEKAESEKLDYEKKYKDIEDKYEDLIEKYNSLEGDYNDCENSYYDLQEKYEESEKFLVKSNAENISLKEKVRILEQSTNRDANLEATAVELSDLRKKYSELQTNVFNMISNKALPHSGVKVPLIKESISKFKNIRFQYSGNTESRKGTYKCMFNEFINVPNEKFLIVDVTSETAIDYVFQMNKIVDGMQWFSSGGGVQKYLTSTCLPNVKVLMPKLGYINDSYYLTVNWEKRLAELENSGYRVVVFCGDISNLVGRVLFESFSELGNTAIYVHGNAIGSRSVIANTSGLSGIKSSIVVYYDFDKNMLKFYNVMSKKCQCKILSYARSM